MPGAHGDDATIADPVGATSRLTAAARARESERDDRLFLDAFAADLAGPEGFATLDRHNTARSDDDRVVPNPGVRREDPVLR
jgi:O-methyltransferase involved in polyketide biosynthesis